MKRKLDCVQKIDIRPEVGLLRIFEAMKYTPWFALGEFVDNAITSTQQNAVLLKRSDHSYLLRVDIRFDEEAGVIEIEDNAAGIARKDLPRALQTASPPTDTRFLSIYGVGMKAAGLWWASTFTIETTALGDNVRRSVTIDSRDLGKVGSGSVPVHESPAEIGEHGTTIRLSNLTKSIPARRTLGKVRSYLASMYRNFILDDTVEIRVQGEALAFEYPALLESATWPSTAGPAPKGKIVKWEEWISIDLSTGEAISGWVGLLAKGSTRGAGFLLTFHGKAVAGVGSGTDEGDEVYRPQVIFGGSNSYRRQRLVGEFDVSAFGKSITSDAVNWEADQEEEFLDKLRKKLTKKSMNFLDMAENYRVRTGTGDKSTSAQTAAEEALKALANTTKAQGPDLKGKPRENPPDSKAIVSASKSAKVNLPLPGGMKSVSVRLSVEQAGEADWLSVYQEKELLIVRVNEDHPFMLSFAQLPKQQIEPVLRLALGVGVAEYIDPDHVRTRLNDLLRGPLASRAGLDAIDE